MPLSKANCDLVRERWSNVRNSVRKMLKEGVDDDYKSLQTGKLFDVSQVKKDIQLLAAVDAHQLLRRMESIVHEHVMNMKVDLWSHLIKSNKEAKIEEIDKPGTFEVTTPEHMISFLKMLLEKFTENHRTVNKMCTLFSEMDQHFTQIGINWRVLNHYLFDSLIYKDALMKIELEVVEQTIGCDLRGSVHDTPEQEAERSLREYSNNNFSHQHFAKSFRLLRRLMLTSREIFKNADAKVKEYAREEINSKVGFEVRKRIVEDEEFFLRQRRYVRWLSKIVPSPSGSCCQAFEEAQKHMFASLESVEDREDDEAFLGRLSQMFERGLNVLTVCAEESERDSSKTECHECGEENCACDSCQLAHLIICGISAEQLNSRLNPETSEGSLEHKCGSGLYIHRFISRGEHMDNAYGSWDFSKWGEADPSDNDEDEEEQEVMDAIEHIEKSTPNARLANAPITIREREAQLKRRRQERELEQYEKSPSTSDTSSESEAEDLLDGMDECPAGSGCQPRKQLFANDGTKALNEQLKKDLDYLKGKANAKDDIPFCCLPHRTVWRRKNANKEQLKRTIFGCAKIGNSACSCQPYPYIKRFGELNVRSANELIMGQQEFRDTFEKDVSKVAFVRYAIKTLISGYAHTMKNFYVDADAKWRRTIVDRVLKEAAEASRLFGEFSYKGQPMFPDPPKNNYEYRVSDVQELIKQNNNSPSYWAKVDIREDDRTFMKRLDSFDLADLYKLDNMKYEATDDAGNYDSLLLELHKLTMLESLWAAMVFASTVILKTDMEFECLLLTANYMGEYIVLTEQQEEEGGYEPVAHFLNMCLIFRTLMKCLVSYVDTLGEVQPKPEDKIWELELDEKGEEEKDHLPDYRNPHQLSLWQKKQLKDARISLLELCEVSGEAVNALKQQKGFVRNRQHLQEQLVLRSLVLKAAQLQKHLDDEKSGVNRQRLNRLRRLHNMKQKENDADWCPHKCEDTSATCCDDTERGEEDLDKIVADIEGDSKARQAKKAKKKQKQQLQKQLADEERRKKEAEQKAVEEAEALRKEEEMRKQQIREEQKRKEDMLKQKENQAKANTGEKEKKKKKAKKGAKNVKDSSPLVIEEPVYSEEGLSWQKSTTPPQAVAVGSKTKHEIPKSKESKEAKRAKQEKDIKEEEEDGVDDENRSEISSMSASESATPFRDTDSVSGPAVEPIDEEPPCYNFMAVGHESAAKSVVPATPPSTAVPTGPITPAPSSSASPHSMDAPPGFENLIHQQRAAQERRRAESGSLLGDGQSLMEQWHQMNADNAEIIRSLLSNQAVQNHAVQRVLGGNFPSQSGQQQQQQPQQQPQFVRQHSAQGLGQASQAPGPSMGRPIVKNTGPGPVPISSSPKMGMFSENPFGKSLPNSSNPFGPSGLVNQDLNGLRHQSRPHPGPAAANPNRHSFIDVGLFGGAFAEPPSSAGRLSVPPDTSRHHMVQDQPFKIQRTSTENMYESDEMFRKCTDDVFKSIWGKVPEESAVEMKDPRAVPRFASASPGPRGLESHRQSVVTGPAPIRPMTASPANVPAAAYPSQQPQQQARQRPGGFGWRNF
ncbi:unnamed protein product, partial [Mesorhabditis spiculigera]